MCSRAITEKSQQTWDTFILVKEKCVLLHGVARITLCGSKDFPDHFSSCHKYYEDSTTWETCFIKVTALTVTWHVATPCRTWTTWVMLAAAHHRQLMLQTAKHPNSALSNSVGSKLLRTEANSRDLCTPVEDSASLQSGDERRGRGKGNAMVFWEAGQVPIG